MQFVGFPSIEQYRNVIRKVSEKVRYAGQDENGKAIFNNAPLPKLNFIATVKLHGTNAGVSLDKDGNIGAQSRNNIVTVEKDNAGWAAFVTKNRELFGNMLAYFFSHGDDVKQVTMFGEWCGGNIQSGVALSNLDKMFVVFAVAVVLEDDRVEWVPYTWWAHLFDESARIYTVHQFKMWQFEIDFNQPELIQNELIRVTNEIEAECPVGKAFGVSGIGEGMVLQHHSDFGHFIFKSKGEKHSVSKVKKLNPVDTEKVAGVVEFVANVVTETRLKQGLDYLREQGMQLVDRNVGPFIKWVNGDVFKEESDTIAENDLDAKMVSKHISNAARSWFFGNLETV